MHTSPDSRHLPASLKKWHSPASPPPCQAQIKPEKCLAVPPLKILKQEQFAQEFVLTGNASEAYRRAYPASQKWKDVALYAKSSAMLAKDKVKLRVDELREEIKKKFDISAERLLQEQARIALFDLRRLFSEEGRLIDPTKMPDDVAAAVSSVKVSSVGKPDGTVETITELKLWSKNTALDSLFKNKGLYAQDNDQSRPLVIVRDFTGENGE